MGWTVCWRCAVVVALGWVATVFGYGLHDPWTHDWPVLWLAGAGPVGLLFLVGALVESRQARDASRVAPPVRPRATTR